MKYKRPGTYIPKPGSRTKIINLNFNIFQDAASTYNFPLSNPNSLNNINQVLSWVKWFYTYNAPPSDSVACLNVNNLNSKFIDFNINGIYFYQDNSTYTTACNVQNLTDYIKSIDQSRLKQMNISTTHGIYSDAAGCVNDIPNLSSFKYYFGIESNSVTFKVDSNLWTGSQNIAHEIGHLLGLNHTYDGFCNIGSFEYLDDVFGPSYLCQLCPHISLWSNPFINNYDGITNNLMGGTIDNHYASPKQIGMMHRSLYLLSPGKYTQCTYDPNNPFEVDTVELWDFINCAPKKGQIINGLLNQMNEKYFNLLV